MARTTVATSGHWTLSRAKLGSPADGFPLPILPVTTRTLADWGFQSGQLRRQSLAPDTLTFERPLVAFDAADEIDFGELITLVDPTGRTRFIGRRVLVPGQASAANESKTYTFAGPWYWFEKLVFHQLWPQLLINAALAPRQTSHFFLNLNGASVGATIQAVAQYAIDQGAPFQLGTIDIPIVPFVTENTDQTCAQIVIGQLRWAPDAAAWFDYSTNPPTFHCRQASNLAATTLTLGPGQSPAIADEGLTIAARPDLQIPSVALRYERTDTLNGVEYLSIGEDIYPPSATGRELNALSQTITLIGSQRTTVQAAILTGDITPASLEWWKQRIPALQDSRIGSLELVPNSVQRVLQNTRSTASPNGTPSSAYPTFLIEGQLADWMRDADDDQVDWEQEELSAEFNFKFFLDDASALTGTLTGQIIEKTKIRIPIHLVSTTAPSGVSDYVKTETFDEGETAPVGLAQYLYNALSALEYEGQVNTTQQECTGYIGPGNRINIAGTAIAAHASMAARVQSVIETIDTGQTAVSFGPTPSLSLGSILELLRASRHRRRWTAASTQTDGETSASLTSVDLGEATANNNTIPGGAQHKYFAVSATPSAPGQPPTRKIELDTANTTDQPSDSILKMIGAGGIVNMRSIDCTFAGVPRTLTIRAVPSCASTDPPGSTWVRLVLSSDRIRVT